MLSRLDLLREPLAEGRIVAELLLQADGKLPVLLAERDGRPLAVWVLQMMDDGLGAGAADASAGH